MFDGQKMRRLRKEKGLTLQALGNAMGGIPLTSVAQLERKGDEPRDVRLSTLLRACGALGCTVYDLLTDDVRRRQEHATRSGRGRPANGSRGENPESVAATEGL
jgi:transcriptional regulator with XRE-family HTH domain